MLENIFFGIKVTAALLCKYELLLNRIRGKKIEVDFVL
jgi:hypothetical protein